LRKSFTAIPYPIASIF